VRIAWSQAPNHGIAFHAALIFNTGRGIRRLGRLAVKYGNGAVSITKSDVGSGTGAADIKTVNAHLVTLAEGHMLVGVPRVGRESYAAQATDRLLACLITNDRSCFYDCLIEFRSCAYSSFTVRGIDEGGDNRLALC